MPFHNAHQALYFPVGIQSYLQALKAHIAHPGSVKLSIGKIYTYAVQ